MIFISKFLASTFIMVLMASIVLTGCSKQSETRSTTSQLTTTTQSTVTAKPTMSSNTPKPTDNLPVKLQLISDNKNFGNGSYADAKNVSPVGFVSQAIVEEGDVVYVIWFKGDSAFVSISKNSQWIVKNKNIGSSIDSRIFGKGFLTFDNKSKTYQLTTINENGEVNVKKASLEGVSFMNILPASKGKAALVMNKTKGKYNLLFDNDIENPIEFEDKKGEFTKAWSAYITFIDRDKQLIYYNDYGDVITDASSRRSNPKFVKVFNYGTGESEYDKDGQILSHKLVSNAGEYPNMFLGDKSKYIVSYKPNSDDIIFTKLKSNFEIEDSYVYPNAIVNSEHFDTTYSSNEIHEWRKIEFKGEPSLQLISVKSTNNK